MNRQRKTTERYRVVEADLERDRNEIAHVWARNFPVYSYEQHQDRFLWNYAHSPFGPGRCWLLLYADAVVGTAGLGFRQLYVGGLPSLTGVASDLAVDTAHRSLHPALLMEKAVISALGTQCLALYGTPNEKSAGLFRRLNYQQVGTAVRWVKVLRSGSLGHTVRPSSLSPVMPAAMTATTRRFVCQLPVFDTRFDDLWRRTVNSRRIVSCRSAHFLTWRYSRYPLKRYTTLALLDRTQEIILGYCVLYACGDEGFSIADFWADARYAHCAEELLTGVIHWCRLRKAAYIALTFGDDGTLAPIFQRFGFEVRHQDGLIMARSCRSSVARALGDWCFLPGDEDYN